MTTTENIASVRLLGPDDQDPSQFVAYELEPSVARMSELLATMLPPTDEEVTETIEIPVIQVKKSILQKVTEFMVHHSQEPMKEIEKPLISANMSEVVTPWYADFIDVEKDTLYEMIAAANYMSIQPLLDLTCAKVASMIKGKSPEQIRQTFNIVNDFTPEEEAQIREENKWCEEV